MFNLILCLCFLLSTLSVQRILSTLVGFYSSALFPPPMPVSLCLDAVSTFVLFPFSSCSALSGLFLLRNDRDGPSTQLDMYKQLECLSVHHLGIPMWFTELGAYI